MGGISVEAEASCRPYGCWLLMTKETAEREDNCLETGNRVQMLSQPLILQDTFGNGGCVDDVGWSYRTGLHRHPIALKGNHLNKRRKKRTTPAVLVNRYQLRVSGTISCTWYAFYNKPTRQELFHQLPVPATSDGYNTCWFTLVSSGGLDLKSEWFYSSGHVLNCH